MMAAETGSAREPVLRVRDLQTHFFTKAGVVKAVDGVSFDVHAGETVGLVGESGSGKSITGFSILGLIDPPGRVVGGEILYRGRNLVGMDHEELRQLRGRRIAMIFQDPMMTLNPVLRVDTQMIEAIQAHEDVSHGEAEARSLEALERVGIPSAAERLRIYPHELSGGMRQRVAIAIALLHKPDVLIADEPTTALDVTIQAQIIYEVQKLARENGTALLWITHDLAVVDGMADTVCVMYAGRLIERGPVAEVIPAPSHPYTLGLLESVPSRNRRGARLRQIPGMTPSPLNLPQGCAFQSRCFQAKPDCQASPDLVVTNGDRAARCFFPLEAGAAEARAQK